MPNIRVKYKKKNTGSKVSAIDTLRPIANGWRGRSSVNILAVDLGTVSGIAHYEFNFAGKPSHEIWHIDEIDCRQDGNSPGEIFHEFCDYMRNVIADIELPAIDAIAFEDVRRHVSSQNARRWCGLLAILQMVAMKNSLLTIPVPVKSAKLDMIGHGHASKEQVQIWAKMQYNKFCLHGLDKRGSIRENEADALLIGEWVFRTARQHIEETKDD